MSGGIDWGAGQRAAFSSLCANNCSATPLTTAFSAPSSCSQNWTPVGLYTVYIASLSLSGPAISLTRNTTKYECLPTQLRTTTNCAACEGSSGLPWISPGICPQGWPTASTGGSIGAATTAYCCPPEAPVYRQLPISGGSACIGTANTAVITLSFDSTITVSTWTSISADGTKTASVYSYPKVTTTPVSTTTYVYAAEYSASPLVVRYMQEDLASLSRLTSSSSSRPTDTTSAPPSPAPGLSTGAKAGIGVGAALGVLALLVLGVLLYRRRQKRRAAQTSAQDPWSPNGYKAELHSEPTPPKELPAQGYGNGGGRGQEYSRGGGREPAELAGH